MSRTKLITGTHDSARSARIDTMAAEHWQRFRLIVPSHAAARERAETLARNAGQPGIWGNPVCDFHQFAEELLQAEGEAVRRLATFERRLLLEDCLAALKYDPVTSAFPGALDSPGVAAHLLRAISDLKQAAIEPDDFLARAGGPSATPQDQLVAAVYAAYQEALLASGAYDVPGLYWRADLIARAGRPRVLADTEVLLFDGFDDFTPSEFRLIQALAPHVEQLAFGINHDDRPARRDLFAVSGRTTARIRAEFDPVVVGCEAPAPGSCRAYAAAHIAWRDIPSSPEGLPADIRLVPCVDNLHEVERTGRAIKTLLLSGHASPDQIAVVSRHDDATATTARRLFAEYGIPTRAATAPPLLESSVARFWLDYFDATASWERAAIVALIASPAVALPGLSAAARAAASHLSRRAQIVGGLRDWRRGLRVLAERIARNTGDDIAALLERLPDAGQYTTELLAAVELLADAQLPPNATAREYAHALDQRIAAWNVAASDADDAARAALRDLLAALAAADSTAIARDVFVRRLQQALHDTTYRPPGNRVGVTVLDAQSIRNRHFDYIYYLGVNENIVPAPPGASAIWPERERGRLRDAGIPLESAQEHNERELLLFHHVLTAARTSIEISWHLQKDAGREASPSPYVVELRELFASRDDILQPAPVADAFLPTPETVASPRDLRGAAVHAAPTLMKSFPEIMATIQPGLEVDSLRYARAPADRYDGILEDAALRADVAADYNADHCFSVSQLEHYIACPFRFFQERVLRIDDTDVPDDTFDPRVRGTILHEALEQFHRVYRGQHVAELPEEAVFATLHTALEAAFTRHDWKCRAAPDGVRAVEHRRMKMLLERYLVDEREKGNTDHTPAHFEVAFGPARHEQGDEESEELSNRRPFVLDTEEGPIAFAGRIDRIDTGDDGVHIIDYKSGGVPPKKDIKSGEDLQMSIYALATEALLLPDTPCNAAWYIGLARKERREALFLGKKEEAERKKNMLLKIEEAIRGIRAGQFAPMRSDPKQCYGCGAAHACRYAEARMALKSL